MKNGRKAYRNATEIITGYTFVITIQHTETNFVNYTFTLKWVEVLTQICIFLHIS